MVKSVWRVPLAQLCCGLFLGSLCLQASCGIDFASSGGKQLVVPTQASVETVDIPLTPVENQGRFGICWAYGTIGLIESSYKKRTGHEINLSEEAVAFYRLAELITETIHSSKNVPDLLNKIRFGYSEGFFSRILPEKKKQGELDALDLVKKYGLVPETVWSVKISDPAEHAQLVGDLRRKTLSYISGRKFSTVTVDDVIENILIGSGPFQSEPPRRFAWGGRNLSPQEFLRQVVGFDPDAFVAVEVDSEGELDQFVTVIKKSLAAGYSVPFGFPINVDRINGGNFTGDAVDLNDAQAFARDGGHLVLISDFVNHGGSEGAVSAAELESELARLPQELSYFKLKNSWGLGLKRDESGREISNSPDGYFRIFRSYLVGASRAAANGFLPLNAVVPQELASQR